MQSMLIDARRELAMPSRRLFGKRMLTLGGLSMLTGCSITDDKSVNTLLTAVSRLNDRAQALLFDPKQLAPTYTEAQITRPFPFNAFYGIDEVPEVNGADYKLKISGLVTGTARLDACPNCTRCRRRADHAAYLRRRLERDRPVGRHAVLPSSCGASARTRARNTSASNAPTTTTKASTCRPRCIAQTLLTLTYDGQRLPAEIRLSDEAAHADQARLQESEAHRRDVRDQHVSRRLLGRTRATTGSAAPDARVGACRTRRRDPGRQKLRKYAGTSRAGSDSSITNGVIP